MMTTEIEVRDQAIARIESLLNRANGRRRERCVGLPTVLGMIHDFEHDDAWSVRNGGSVANAYNYPATTTYVILARVAGRVHLGITEADANKTSPGRAYPVLQPWRKGQGPTGDAAAKWAAWAASSSIDGSDVILLEDPEVDTIKSMEV